MPIIYRMSDSDDDVPTLSADTLAALQSFYDEQADENQKLTTALQTGKTADIDLKEDWVSFLPCLFIYLQTVITYVTYNILMFSISYTS